MGLKTYRANDARSQNLLVILVHHNDEAFLGIQFAKLVVEVPLDLAMQGTAACQQ